MALTHFFLLLFFFPALSLPPLLSTAFWVRKLPTAFLMMTRELLILVFSTVSYFGTVLRSNVTGIGGPLIFSIDSPRVLFPNFYPIFWILLNCFVTSPCKTQF